MKKTDDPKIQAAQWFLEFISDDLEKMTPLDFDRRVVEAKHYFMEPKKDLAWLLYSGKSFSGQSFSGWPEQGRIGIKPILKDSYPWKENLKFTQSFLRDFLKESIKANNKISAFDKVDFLFGTVNGIMRAYYDPPNYLIEDTHDDPSNLAKTAKFSFANALNGIPRDAIKTCRECGKYFLHLSKKPKYFCSPKCTVKATSRRRRERDPEGYRAKQREIMRKKYEKDQKAKGYKKVTHYKKQGKRED